MVRIHSSHSGNKGVVKVQEGDLWMPVGLQTMTTKYRCCPSLLLSEVQDGAANDAFLSLVERAVMLRLLVAGANKLAGI